MNFSLPDSFRIAIYAQNNGIPHTKDLLDSMRKRMEYYYARWIKYAEKEKYLLEVEWEEMEYERYSGGRIWRNAHKRLRKYREVITNMHKQMFTILTHLDGNYNVTFSETCWSAKEIYESFIKKYVENTKNILIN